MAEIQSESTAVIGNRELREDMLHKLKKEFDIIHEAISKNQMAPEKLKALIDGQYTMSLSGSCIRTLSGRQGLWAAKTGICFRRTTHSLNY